jgi:hypothetical protein
MAEVRKVHRYTTLSKDLLQFSQIEKIVDSKVKEFRGMNKSIISTNKEINSLKGKEDPDSLKKLEQLQKDLEVKNMQYKEYSDSVTKGSLTEKIISELKKSESPIQLQDRGKVPIGGSSLTGPIQKMVEKKFSHEEIKNSYAKRNLDYYQEINGGSVPADAINKL